MNADLFGHIAGDGTCEVAALAEVEEEKLRLEAVYVRQLEACR
jgi:hypothetical protein